jgi:hypothetical protein
LNHVKTLVVPDNTDDPWTKSGHEQADDVGLQLVAKDVCQRHATCIQEAAQGFRGAGVVGFVVNHLRGAHQTHEGRDLTVHEGYVHGIDGGANHDVDPSRSARRVSGSRGVDHEDVDDAAVVGAYVQPGPAGPEAVRGQRVPQIRVRRVGWGVGFDRAARTLLGERSAPAGKPYIHANQ